MMQIKKVIPKADFRMEVLFENGNSVILDFTSRLKTIRFGLLGDNKFFRCAVTDGTLINWNNKIEMSVSEVIEMENEMKLNLKRS